jgi:hypothetical protein
MMRSTPVDQVNPPDWLSPGWHFTTLLRCVMRRDGRPAIGVQASGPLRVWIAATANDGHAEKQWQF